MVQRLEGVGELTDLITPYDCAVEMMRLSGELAKAHNDTVAAARKFADAERAYAIAYARARANAEGRDSDTRKASAESACADERFAKTMADLVRQSCRDNENNIRQQMSALQTVTQTVKVDVEMGGFQGQGRRAG